jgi:ABC-type phosphate transport system substrate-binding protein
VPAVIGKESYAAAFFRQQVLLQRPYLRELRYLEDFTKAEALVKKHPGVIIIVNLSGRGGSSALKAAAVGRNNGSNAVFPERPQIFTGEYPLARFLNIYLVREPGEQLDPSLLDFLRFVLSRQGQTIAVREGLYPLSLDILQAELANL